MIEKFVQGQCYCHFPLVEGDKCKLCGGKNPKIIDKIKKVVKK